MTTMCGAESSQWVMRAWSNYGSHGSHCLGVRSVLGFLGVRGWMVVVVAVTASTACTSSAQPSGAQGSPPPPSSAARGVAHPDSPAATNGTAHVDTPETSLSGSTAATSATPAGHRPSQEVPSTAAASVRCDAHPARMLLRDFFSSLSGGDRGLVARYFPPQQLHFVRWVDPAVPSDSRGHAIIHQYHQLRSHFRTLQRHGVRLALVQFHAVTVRGHQAWFTFKLRGVLRSGGQPAVFPGKGAVGCRKGRLTVVVFGPR